MLSLNALFINKLWGIHQRCLANDIFDESILRMIVKTSLLAFICIGITTTSCIFLIMRFTFNIENVWIDLIGDILISVDIYTNFIFVILSFKYFSVYYQCLFGRLEDAMISFLTPKAITETAKAMQLSQLDSTTRTSASTSKNSIHAETSTQTIETQTV